VFNDESVLLIGLKSLNPGLKNIVPFALKQKLPVSTECVGFPFVSLYFPHFFLTHGQDSLKIIPGMFYLFDGRLPEADQILFSKTFPFLFQSCNTYT